MLFGQVIVSFDFEDYYKLFHKVLAFNLLSSNHVTYTKLRLEVVRSMYTSCFGQVLVSF